MKRKIELPRSTSIFYCLKHPKILVFRFFSNLISATVVTAKRKRMTQNCPSIAGIVFQKVSQKRQTHLWHQQLKFFCSITEKRNWLAVVCLLFWLEKTSELLHFNFDNTCLNILLKIWNKGEHNYFLDCLFGNVIFHSTESLFWTHSLFWKTLFSPFLRKKIFWSSSSHLGQHR